MIMFLVATERKMKSSPLWISQKFIKIITIRSCISSLNILLNVWITCTFLLKHFKFTVMFSFYVVCHFSCKSRAKSFIRKRKKPSNTTTYLNGHRGASDNPCRNSPSAHYGISAPRDIAFSRIAPDLMRRRQDRPWREVSLCEWQDPAHRRVMASSTGYRECMRVHMYDQFSDTQSATPGIYRPIASLRYVTYGVSRQEGFSIPRKTRLQQYCCEHRDSSRQISLQFWIESKIWWSASNKCIRLLWDRNKMHIFTSF